MSRLGRTCMGAWHSWLLYVRYSVFRLSLVMHSVLAFQASHPCMARPEVAIATAVTAAPHGSGDAFTWFTG